MAKIKEAMQAARTTAKSAAHQGVVARPMDKNLSKILDQRRAQAAGPASSVARLGKEGESASNVAELGKEQLTKAQEKMNEGPGTSVARLGKNLNDIPLENLPPGIARPRPPSGSEPTGDLG